MSRTFALSPPGLDELHAYVQRSMDGTGRVDADELARLLAEHEPAKHRQPQTQEFSDAQYEQLFEARFGPSYSEAPGAVNEDGYAAEFATRFGFEASL